LIEALVGEDRHAMLVQPVVQAGREGGQIREGEAGADQLITYLDACAKRLSSLNFSYVCPKPVLAN
jgi:hypothetical protein